MVIWPGDDLTGRPVEVAGELDRLGDGQDDLAHSAAQDGEVFSTRARTWSTPAAG